MESLPTTWGFTHPRQTRMVWSRTATSSRWTDGLAQWTLVRRGLRTPAQTPARGWTEHRRLTTLVLARGWVVLRAYTSGKLGMPYEISEDKRDWYRAVTARSRQRKLAASRGLLGGVQRVNVPDLRPETLMPKQPSNGLRALSLFSGGGGLDLGFERAGFEHVASFDVLEVCGATLKLSRPHWQVFSGAEGDVSKVDWSPFRGNVEVLHGGPPCQPFSIAGRRSGGLDDRDMWPLFTRAVLRTRPAAFVAENVPGLLDGKFAAYVGKGDTGTIEGRLPSRQFSLDRNRLRCAAVAQASVFRRVRL